jgi:uracil-DNA glycosylase
MSTFHPEAMLQNADSANIKAIVWDDLKKVMRRLQLRPPRRNG